MPPPQTDVLPPPLIPYLKTLTAEGSAIGVRVDTAMFSATWTIAGIILTDSSTTFTMVLVLFMVMVD